MDYSRYYEKLKIKNIEQKEYLKNYIFNHGSDRGFAGGLTIENAKYSFVISSDRSRGTYGVDFIGLVVEIYINGHDFTESYFEQLKKHKADIETELLDTKLFWEKSPNKPNTYRIYSRFAADIEDESKWDEYIDWHLNTMIKFLQVFPKYTKNLKKEKIVEEDKKAEDAIEDNTEVDKPKTKNIILYGAPGVGKTHNTKKLISLIESSSGEKEIFDEMKLNKNDDGNDLFKIVETIKDRVKSITFHQSFSYEDFIEGYRPDGNGNIILQNGIFKNICDEASKDENRDKKFYLVIDEINRGNISKIFGELITLIEESKRGEKWQIELPYSKKPFFVPENLYIIGTMNSTDKSIALIDIALRRRFTFLKMLPNPELIKDDSAKRLMQNLNNYIKTSSLGEDYQLGHSYFMDVKNDVDLEFVKEYKIKPLMEEYFYGDIEGLKKAAEILGLQS